MDTPLAKRNLDLLGVNLSAGTNLNEEITNAADITAETMATIPEEAVVSTVNAATSEFEVVCTDDPITPPTDLPEDCGDSEVCTQLLEESLAAPTSVGTGELRHRVTHSTSETTSYEVPAAVPHTSTASVGSESQTTSAATVTPAVAVQPAQAAAGAAAPAPVVAPAAAAQARAAVAPQAAVAPVRDAVDEMLNTIIKLLIIAILYVLYKIANKHL